MSSPKAGPAVVQRKSVKSQMPVGIPIPAVRCATPASYVYLTPVLVPYVQAPVQYIKTRSKKAPEVVTLTPVAGQKARAVVRYVPAVYQGSPSYTARYVYNDGRAYAAPVYCKPTVYSRVDANGLLPAYTAIAQSVGDANVLHPLRVAALASRVQTVDPKSAPKTSKLNPLSRPYTPPSRSRVCFCDQSDSTTDEIWCYKAKSASRASTPDSWSDETLSDVLSRSVSPDPPHSCCTHQRKDLSDVDSGVEGESDDENWCPCDCETSTKSTDLESSDDSEDEVVFPDLRHPRYRQDTLSRDSSHLVDFVCDHLQSHEWRTVARELGVDDVIIQSVDYDVYENFREEMRYVFSYWIGSDESLTTSEGHRLLIAALSEVGRTDLIQKLTADCQSDAED